MVLIIASTLVLNSVFNNLYKNLKINLDQAFRVQIVQVNRLE